MHYKADPSFMKTQLLHYFLNETPLNSVICFAHIELDNHETLFSLSFMVQVVHELKGDQHIVSDKLLGKEGPLIFSDDLRKNGFDLVS